MRRGHDPHEHRLARRAAAGDEAAFAELYQRYRRRVRAYVGAALRDPHAAQDAAQEVFARVYAGLPGFEPRPGAPLWAWVFGIAGNVVNEERRRRRRAQPWDPAWIVDHRDRTGHAREPHDELTWGAWALRELAPLVRRLPRPQAEAFVLVAVLGYRPAEAARTMGRTAADVRQLKHRALVRLSQPDGSRHLRGGGAVRTAESDGRAGRETHGMQAWHHPLERGPAGGPSGRFAARRARLLAIGVGAAGLAMAVAGCGGRPHTPAGQPSTAGRAAPSAATEATARPRTRRRHAVPAAAPAATRQKQMSRYARAAGAAGRARAIDKVATSYLRAYRLVDATYRVTRHGYGVEVLIPAADVCTSAGRTAGNPNFARDLRDAVGFLRVVTIRVAGSGGGVRSYLRRHCRPPTHVYEKSGSGPFTTPAFAIPGTRWILFLASREGNAQVEAVAAEAGRPVATLTLTGPGVTSRAVRSRGRFRLRVRGRGDWNVTVLMSAL